MRPTWMPRQGQTCRTESRCCRRCPRKALSHRENALTWWTNCCRTLSTLVAPDHRRPADMLEAWRLEKRMHSTRAPQNVASSNQALAPVILILNVPAPMIWKSILRRTKLIWKPDMPTMLVDLVRRNNRGDHQMRHMW